MMVGSRVPTREVPYCSLCLVISTVICHGLVLTGNLLTASGFNTLGKSTSGWSAVGIGLARALADELDEKMILVTEQLTQALNQTVEVQEYLDIVVSLAANGTDAKGAAGEAAAFLQLHSAPTPTVMSLLQEHAQASGPLDSLPGLLISSMDTFLDALILKAVDLLEKLLDVLRPALEQVGEWILEFGDKIQAIVDAVSGTMDQVQKLFDQVMAQLHGGGGGEDLMVHDTYALFDPDNIGFITADSLRQTAQLYALTPLAGSKPEELIDKYDQDGDGRLSLKEFGLMVKDDSVPNIMAAVLRTYSQKLGEVAGNVGSAKMRDEVATTIVRYFGLVCAKNLTKVGWVSDRLTNGSLPLEFTADVMAEFCLTEDDPNKLSSAEVGQIVISNMMELNSTTTMAAFDLMSETDFWTAEGLPMADYPRCVERVTQWVMNATDSAGGLLEDQGRLRDGLSAEALAAIPITARRLASERTARLRRQEHQLQASRHQALLSTSTSRVISFRLLGGTMASDGFDPASVSETLHAGVTAQPETLEFARLLASNASSAATRFQKQCLGYTSQSSSPMDSITVTVQGMTKKFTTFLAMMEKYSTPSGMDALEAKVRDFAENAADDVKIVIKDKLGDFINKSGPAIVDAVEGAVQSAGDAISQTLGRAVGQPLAHAIGAPLGYIIGQAANDTDMGSIIGDKVGDVIGSEIVNLTENVLGREIGNALETMLGSALEAAAGSGFEGHLNATMGAPSVSTVAAAAPSSGAASELSLRAELQQELSGRNVAAERQNQDPRSISGSWSTVVSTLSSVARLLPASTGILKFARLEVSKLTHRLQNVFVPFQQTGPRIFDTIAWYWRALWCTYFVLMFTLLMGILFYAFWTSGFFGGPVEAELSEQLPPRPITWRDRLSTCWSGCTSCMRDSHDWHLALWSLIILMQVLVLLLFVVSLVLCILAGVKAFVHTGCAQVYILTDKLVCGESMKTIKSWLDSFYVTDALLPVEQACEENHLLTCSLISDRMQLSMLFTTIFSFLAVVLTMQIVIDTAVRHERARWHRILVAMEKEDKGK
mmetsp:Transcript_17975/g.41960  ORF Transcript_17975/g.41960 Transcript_17975/m.41960 type:complete len:1056 (+) Transcript_17975:161-3328(+)